MKKSIIILFSVILLPFGLKSQMVVTDPGNTGINAVIQTLNEAANKLNKFVADSKLLELSTEALQQIQSIQEMADLVNELECLTSEFKMYMNLGKSYSCATYLNFQLLNFNLGYTTDILSKVLLAKNIFTMSSSDRLTNMDNIRKTLEQTIKDMHVVNTVIKNSIQKTIVNKYTAQYYKSSNISYNRYSRKL